MPFEQTDEQTSLDVTRTTKCGLELDNKGNVITGKTIETSSQMGERETVTLEEHLESCLTCQGDNQ